MKGLSGPWPPSPVCSVPDDLDQGFHSPFDQLELSLTRTTPRDSVYESPAGTVSVEHLRHPPSAKGLRLIKNGLKYAQTGAHEKAIDEYRQALSDPASVPYARSLLGAEYLKAGDLSAAARELSEAIRLMPREAANHSNLGYAYLLTGRRADAEMELRTAIQLDHTSVQPRYLLGLLLLDQGTQEAADNLSRAQKLFKKARLALAIFHMRHGESAAAEQDLRAIRCAHGGAIALLKSSRLGVCDTAIARVSAVSEARACRQQTKRSGRRP